MCVVKSQLEKRWLGYETKFKQEIFLKLSNSPHFDVVAVYCEDGEWGGSNNTVCFKRHVSSGDYQQTKSKRSKKRIPTGKLFSLRKHDLIQIDKDTGFIKGKRSTGFFVIENILGETITNSVNIKKNMVRLSARTTALT